MKTPVNVRRWIGSVLHGASLIFGVALLSVGLISTGILKDRTWDAGSLAELGILAVLAVLLAVVTMVFDTKRRVIVTIVSVTASVGFFGFAATTAILFLLLASLAIGELLTNKDNWVADDEVSQVPILVIIGLAVLVVAAGVLMHFPVNTALTYFVGLSIPVFFARASLTQRMRCIAVWATNVKSRRSRSSPWLVSVIAFLLALHLFATALPERGHDALATHLMVPMLVAERGRWSFDFQQHVWAVMPMGGDWLYAVAYLLAGEASARLLNLICFLLVVWLLGVILRRWLSLTATLLTIALFVSTPVAWLETSTLFVENPLMMFLFAAFVVGAWSLPQITTLRIAICFLLMAAAVTVKVLAVFAAVPLGMALLVAVVMKKGWRGALPSLLIASALVLVGLHPYLYAFVVTGNPLFPFLNAVFKSPYFSPDENFSDTHWLRGLDPLLLYNMTFASERFLESGRGSMGFQFVVFFFAGSVALFRLRHPALLLAFTITAVYVTVVTFQIQYIRYLYPIFPLLTLICGLALSIETRKGWQTAISFLALGVVALNAWFMPTASWMVQNLRFNAFVDSASVISRQAPQRDLVAIVNGMAGDTSRVAFLGQPSGAGLRGTALYANWYNPRLLKKLREATSVEAVSEIYGALRVSYSIADEVGIARFPVVEEFLSRRATVISRVNHAALYKTESSVLYSRELLANNRFKRGLESWMGERAEPLADGMRLEASGLLAQPAAEAVRPAASYLYSVKFRCPEGKGSLRLQINWGQEEGRFLQGSASDLRCRNSAARQEEIEFHAPRKSRSMMLYAVAGAAGPVVVESLSLLAMRESNK